uniref:E3 ubiquitin-protein ligase APD1-4 middle domain-containing protein n=2 Tax=Homalodisca liturata TaxID=320908 RepID=A0A1B6HWY8_9HEMI
MKPKISEPSGNVVFYQPYKYSSLNALHGLGKMHGARRVIAFCLMTAVLPTILLIIPLYLRHSVYTDTIYAVAESDVVEMGNGNGISTVFCQGHSLRMNSTFSAFQMAGIPETSQTNRKHIQLKKSMNLPDDTLEYWGFYLPRGSTVNLSVCARYDGAHILVVSGDKVLNNCGPITPSMNGAPHMAQGQGKVVVTYEGSAKEIFHSDSQTFREQLKARANIGEEDDTENHGGEVDEENMAEVLERKQRHQRTRRKHVRDFSYDKEENTTDEKRDIRKRDLEDLLNSKDLATIRRKRKAEAVPKIKLDGGIAHGGNAINFTKSENDSSISSFEQNLLTCHDGRILLWKEFSPSELCTNFNYLVNNHSHLQTTHEVVENGYYYYIFYSDNDFRDNSIHAVFDIYKPTYQYLNYTKGCINVTECTFPIKMFSDDMVVVEVPTRDGIEHESDDITHLVSTCQPRTAIYAIFPVAVLFLILGCAFL